jgi:hypothetical protein
MSRADRERAIYVSKLTTIKENLINSFPDIQVNKELLVRIQQSIKDELEKVKEEHESSEEESDCEDDDERV